MDGYGAVSPTIEALAAAQNVAPISDATLLYGTWPGDPDDGFEEAVDELRHSTVVPSKR